MDEKRTILAREKTKNQYNIGVFLLWAQEINLRIPVQVSNVYVKN
jgi:hypothetical protein